jgi:carboxymethylenebutenolidase
MAEGGKTRADGWTMPPAGTGPGLLLLGGNAAVAKRLAEDGYVVLADGDIEALAARSEPDSKIGLVAFGAAAEQALALAAAARVDALACYDPPADAIAARARDIKIPAVFHFATAADAQKVRAAFGKRLNARAFDYPDSRAGFALEGGPDYDRIAANVSYSRTLSVLRKVLGPDYNLAALFDEHLRHEFITHDADATMATMVEQPYVNHIPTLAGGYGHDMLKRFYKYHFIPKIPKDRKNTMISEIVGSDTIVREMLNEFTFTDPFDHYLPGVKPNGRKVKVPVVVIAKFRGDKLYYEHIYWDQATILKQLGLIDTAGLPVSGAEQADKMRDPSLPANQLMAEQWKESEGKPL